MSAAEADAAEVDTGEVDTGEVDTGEVDTGEVDAGEVDEVKMAVDQEICISGGQCEMLEPDTFLVDDDLAIAAVIGTGLLSRLRALELIDRCPAGAISLSEVQPSSGAESSAVESSADSDQAEA